MTTKRRRRHSPEQIVRKLRDADAIRRSCATDPALRRRNVWVKRLAKRLELDLTIRPRGRPRKSVNHRTK